MVINGIIFNENNVIAMQKVKCNDKLDIIYLTFKNKEHPISIYVWKDGTQDIKDINAKYEHLKNLIEKD